MVRPLVNPDAPRLTKTALQLATQPCQFRLEVSAHSLPGLRRAGNQDAILCLPGRGLFALADGLGGHAAGDVAARVALAAVEESLGHPSFFQQLDDFMSSPNIDEQQALSGALRKSVLAANRAVLETAGTSQAYAGMATTLDVLLLTGSCAFFAHVGDARAYVLRSGLLLQLSEDHCSSDMFRSTGKRATSRSPKGPLSQSIGGPSRLDIHTGVVELTAATRLLLCSDGAYLVLDEPLVAAQFVAGLRVDSGAADLVAAAHALDSADDASAILLTLGEPLGPLSAQLHSNELDARALDESPLLVGLSARHRTRVLEATVLLDLEAGSSLRSSAAGDRSAYLVLDGQIALSNGRVLGGAALVFAESLLGIASRDPLPIVLERARVLRLRESDFLAICQPDSGLSAELHRRLAQLLARGR